MPKILAVSLLLLMPLAAWSKNPTVQETCKQVIALTGERGMLHVSPQPTHLDLDLDIPFRIA
ncbi:MAG: hypothetical protein CMN90_00020 [Sutterellaceae bacterium]|jgi:hypothetical protein|uniref:hypothetical protein n=1 Tax=uncultured Limnobacter sp. TaxID=199681 RepID=UPI000C536AAB|nr:hypothetical protein [uncultured Limnobacter sp.]MAZ08041.1 hypothetical protein [Sutterellaceae bacterium]MBE9130181.1 hypothetical protein [Coleofasciculus sp. LEGE 07081]|tara:strand:- start:1321 stop:1506 length:186 start_codon:yes stop_codon:yes gene_type:complete